MDTCNEPLPPGQHGNRKYCLPPAKCADRARERKRYAREKALRTGLVAGRKTRAESADGRATARRGPVFERLRDEGFLARIAAGEMSVSQVQAESGESQANVSRAYAAYEEELLLGARREGWARSAEVEAVLADFEAFRLRYFVTPEGKPYLTEGFHKKWIASILHALETGGRQMILSPPRHGKSDLLAHFCVWLICTNPNIRIMWIGGNEAIAKLCVSVVLDTLENNVLLRDEILGPGGTFKPSSKSGRSWSAEKFTVATRDRTGIRAPTMVAIGKGGKLLSRDADLIVADDIQDDKEVWSPSNRDRDVHWWTTQVSTRKEANTALIVIGSRQHHEDLYGRLLKNAAWSSRTIVEQAHDPACPLPVHPIRDGHDEDCPDCAQHVDCMLFPAVRPMAFIQECRAEHSDDVAFEMVYQNVTRPSGEQYVTADQIEPCKNYDRTCGRWLEIVDRDGRRMKDVRIPPGTRLIAGLDPAVRGIQAAVLWAVDMDTMKRYLIDLDARRAGGMPGARAIIQDWFDLYHCAYWVIERNNYQEVILQDRDILDFTSRNGIHLEPSFTDGHNKWNKDFGVTKQLGLFRADPPMIDLPWGDEESRAKVRQIIEQWVNFEPVVGKGSARSRSGHGDILMAGWLPEGTIRRWRRDQMTEIVTEYDQTGYFDGGLGNDYRGIAA